MMEERHHLTLELHDSVVQRLFAAGVQLQGARADRLASVSIDVATELDHCITLMRSTMFTVEARR